MGRELPTKCRHGAIVDWGDFGFGPPEKCDQCKSMSEAVLIDMGTHWAWVVASEDLGFIEPGPGIEVARGRDPLEATAGLISWARTEAKVKLAWDGLTLGWEPG